MVQLQNQEDRLSQILSSFSCHLDEDNANFLHNRAAEFEKLQKSKTYLVFDEDSLANDPQIVIWGYFTVALKSLELPQSMSTRTRRELDGFSGKANNAPIASLPCYLIGQLARNDRISKEQLPGKELLTEALRVILSAADLVGGRLAMIECHNDEHLKTFYRENGFETIGSDQEDGKTMVQMLCKIC